MKGPFFTPCPICGTLKPTNFPACSGDAPRCAKTDVWLSDLPHTRDKRGRITLIKDKP